NIFAANIRFYKGLFVFGCPSDKVRRNSDTCMSRELPTVFHVIDSASRENIGGNYVSTDILSLTGHFY
ncbi:MAG: hypothetical protein LBS69_06915, partial [Prevotellaceae bacterium]|nr:hypothetical protein [Prevotellaceae bacterium]